MLHVGLRVSEQKEHRATLSNNNGKYLDVPIGIRSQNTLTSSEEFTSMEMSLIENNSKGSRVLY